MNIKKVALICATLFLAGIRPLLAQPKYSVNANAHSHNDYLQSQPFYSAHANRFASMEIDVFLVGSELYVAHDRKDIDTANTIERLYINPLLEQFRINGGKPYKDDGKLQLMIDLKTDGQSALKVLEKKLKPLREYFDTKINANAVRLVLSGSIPEPSRFKEFDEIFFFDGRPGINYSKEQLKRIAFFSTALQQFTKWNGLGRIVENERAKIEKFIDSVHTIGKPVRFWGNPDTRTCWQAFIKMGVDYLNTDSPAEMAKFLNTYDANSYKATLTHKPYLPTFQTDGTKVHPKNVILLISDGAGFSQIWAAATANGGILNVTGLKQIGYSNTSSANDYNTDSAAGATAMSTGEKTNNRFIGMNRSGEKIPNIVEVLSKRGYLCGIVSNDNMTGATPSSFFAHQVERDSSTKIAEDILNSPANLIIAGFPKAFEDLSLMDRAKANGLNVVKGIQNFNKIQKSKRVICFDNDSEDGSFRLIESAFDAAVERLNTNQKKGFFLVIEGAKIDAGGHANTIKQSIDEYLSFDKVVGKAVAFADRNKETLVIITSDHETGGLIVLDGNYEKGTILGAFATNDHTGLPVPVFSYGPGSAHFKGFFQNSAITSEILKLLN